MKSRGGVGSSQSIALYQAKKGLVMELKSNMRQQMSGPYSDGSKGRRSGFVPTPEQRRSYMRQSKEGGRCFCDKCGYAFAAAYVKPIVRSMKTLNLCEDCRRELCVSKSQ